MNAVAEKFYDSAAALAARHRLFIRQPDAGTIEPASPMDVYNAAQLGVGQLYVVTRRGSQTTDSKDSGSSFEQESTTDRVLGKVTRISSESASEAHRVVVDYSAFPIWDAQTLSVMPLENSHGQALEGVQAGGLNPRGGRVVTVDTYDYRASGSSYESDRSIFRQALATSSWSTHTWRN